MRATAIILRITLVILLVVPFSAVFCGAGEDLSLARAWEIIRTKRFVDLTHTFAPGIPHWKGFPDEKRETLYGYEPGAGKLGSGFYAQAFTFVGQWGTHADPPAHFVKGLRTLDQIDVKEMILPLVVVTFPKPKDGSGFPARVFAILP